MTDEEIIAALLAEGIGKPSASFLRNRFGIGYKRARRLRDHLRSNSGVRLEATGETAVVEASGMRIRTLEDLLAAARVDRRLWIVERYTVNSWEGPSKEGLQNYFQVKAHLRRSPAAALEAVLDRLRIPRFDADPRAPALTGALLVVSPADSHFGKLAWGKETGKDYDIKIAAELYLQAIQTLYERGRKLAGDGFERILFVVGNDLLHVDYGRQNSTTAGTPQDVDTRWQKAFEAALQAVVQATDMLALQAPLDIVVQPGNHDEEKAAVLGYVLRERYRASEHVRVLLSPAPRRYYRFHDILLGIAHGSDVKVRDLPMLMAKEAKRDWSEAEYHEWLLGHFHRKFEQHLMPIQEHGGVRIRVLPSLSAPDAWHTRKGFNVAVRASEALVYSKGEGYVATLSYTVR